MIYSTTSKRALRNTSYGFTIYPGDRGMKSGRTLWDELCFKYHSGARKAHAMESQWLTLKGKVDDRRHSEVAAKLHKQAQDADVWALKCLTYFAQFSKMPISQS